MNQPLCLIMNWLYGKRQSWDHNSKTKEEKFYSSTGISIMVPWNQKPLCYQWAMLGSKKLGSKKQGVKDLGGGVSLKPKTSQLTWWLFCHAWCLTRPHSCTWVCGWEGWLRGSWQSCRPHLKAPARAETRSCNLAKSLLKSSSTTFGSHTTTKLFITESSSFQTSKRPMAGGQCHQAVT